MKVVIAVIVDKQGRILITQRSLKKQLGGLWEFPGGKVEEGESPVQTLIREIKEEVNLDVTGFDFLSQIHHDYASHQVTLFVYRVQSFHGKALCCEEQSALRWVAPQQLKDYAFPEANHAIIKSLI